MNTAPIPQAVMDAANPCRKLLEPADFDKLDCAALAASLGLTPAHLRPSAVHAAKSFAAGFAALEFTEVELLSADRAMNAMKDRGEPMGYANLVREQMDEQLRSRP